MALLGVDRRAGGTIKKQEERMEGMGGMKEGRRKEGKEEDKPTNRNKTNA